MLLGEYIKAARTKGAFFKQNFRVLWLKEGDRNNSYFFKTMVNRRNRKRILNLKADDGSDINGEEEVKAEATNYFMRFGVDNITLVEPNSRRNTLLSFGMDRINDMQVTYLTREVEADEIKQVLFSFNDLKAPGPDGFNSYFFLKKYGLSYVEKLL